MYGGGGWLGLVCVRISSEPLKNRLFWVVPDSTCMVGGRYYNHVTHPLPLSLSQSGSWHPVPRLLLLQSCSDKECACVCQVDDVLDCVCCLSVYREFHRLLPVLVSVLMSEGEGSLHQCTNSVTCPSYKCTLPSTSSHLPPHSVEGSLSTTR